MIIFDFSSFLFLNIGHIQPSMKLELGSMSCVWMLVITIVSIFNMSKLGFSSFWFSWCFSCSFFHVSYGMPLIPAALPAFEEKNASWIWCSCKRLYSGESILCSFCGFGISCMKFCFMVFLAFSISLGRSSHWMLLWCCLAISAISSERVARLFEFSLLRLCIISLGFFGELIFDQYLLIVSLLCAQFACDWLWICLNIFFSR